MDFKVPEGFDDFVTSAEDLLNEFKNGSQCDFVHYSIHFRSNSLAGLGKYGLMLSDALVALQDINDYIKNNFSYYLWQKDPFSLRIVPYSTTDSNPKFYIEGYSSVGDNIDDEWFSVYLLLKLSELPELKEASFSIVDNDGQFILIEVSDHIPDWLGPENADNRVWIRNGTICILDIEDVPGDSANCVSLEGALQYINTASASGLNESSFLIVDKRIQKAVAERTTLAYPAKAKALMHRVVCILPRWVETVLCTNPQLVSLAVNCFFTFDARDRVTCKEYFPVDAAQHYPSLKEEIKRVSEHTFNGDARHAVVSQVQLTRPLFAQLTFKKFHPPKKYHALMRLVRQFNSRAVDRAFDLGCRLAVGFEAAYHQSLYYWKILDRERETQNLLMNLVCRSGYLKELSVSADKRTVNYIKSLVDSRTLTLSYKDEDPCDLDGFKRPGVSVYFHTILAQSSGPLLCESKDKNCDFIIDCSAIVNKQLISDKEDWLYMTPEEMDKEMNARMQQCAGEPTSPSCDGAGEKRVGNSKSSISKKEPLDSLCGVGESVIPSDADAVLKVDEKRDVDSDDENVEEVTHVLSALEVDKKNATSGSDHVKSLSSGNDQLQTIVDGIKTFLKGESDFDGFNPQKKMSSTASKPTRTQIRKKAGSPCTSGGMGLNVDKDHLQRLLQSTISSLPGTSTVNNIDTATPKVPPTKAKDDLSYFFDEKDLEVLSSDEEDYNSDFDECEDSGDGKDMRRHEKESADFDGEDKLMREYMQMMDAQIYGTESTMGRTFETKNNLPGKSTTEETTSAGNTENSSPGDGDVDIDLNLLKNLLDSHAYSLGSGMPGASPAAALLAQYGISMPLPPQTGSQKGNFK